MKKHRADCAFESLIVTNNLASSSEVFAHMAKVLVIQFWDRGSR